MAMMVICLLLMLMSMLLVECNSPQLSDQARCESELSHTKLYRLGKHVLLIVSITTCTHADSVGCELVLQ